MLYFEESVLQAAEEVRVRDVLEAIEKASGKPAHQRVEIWRRGRRVAEVGISPLLQ
jgi:aminopeptidase N